MGGNWHAVFCIVWRAGYVLRLCRHITPSRRASAGGADGMKKLGSLFCHAQPVLGVPEQSESERVEDKVRAALVKEKADSATVTYVDGVTKKINPHFPALRSGHRLFQRPSPRKQIPSNKQQSMQTNCGIVHCIRSCCLRTDQLKFRSLDWPVNAPRPTPKTNFLPIQHDDYLLTTQSYYSWPSVRIPGGRLFSSKSVLGHFEHDHV
jgi:hypothetical protein